MNNWVPIAVAVIAIASQILVATERGAAAEACPSHGVVATAPPDFLFATAEDWKRFALEAELDRLR